MIIRPWNILYANSVNSSLEGPANVRKPAFAINAMLSKTATVAGPPEQTVGRRPLRLDTALSGVVSGVEESVNARFLG